MEEDKLKIKAVVFDIEGILTKENGEEQRKIFAEELNINEKSFSDSAKKYLDLVHKGNIDGLQFFQFVCDDLSIEKSRAPEMVKKWLEIRENTLEVNEDVWKTLETLKEKSYLTVAFTNITKLNQGARIKKVFIPYLSSKFYLLKQDTKNLNKGYIIFYCRIFLHRTSRQKKQYMLTIILNILLLQRIWE